MRLHRPLAVLVAALCSALFSAASAEPAARRQVGALVYDGIPDLPAEAFDGVRPYTSIRGASFQGVLPDGSVLIRTRFGESTQLHQVRGPGAARTQLTFFGESVDGASVDLAAPDEGVYLAMDEGGDEQTQLYWYRRADGRRVRLTDGVSKNEGAAPSRLGGRLYFFSTARNGVDHDLWEVRDREPATRRMVRELQGHWALGAESPDGTKLVLLRDVSAVEDEIWLLDLAAGTFRELLPGEEARRFKGVAFSGDGEALWLTTDLGREFLGLARLSLGDPASGAPPAPALTFVEPAPSWDVESVTVSPDGRWMGWRVNAGGRSEAWIAPEGRPERARRIELPVGVAYGLAFDPYARRAFITLSTQDAEADVWEVALPRLAPTRWTWSETGGLDTRSFVTPTLVTWPSFDGRAITGWLYQPPGVAKAPVVIGIHGGPEAQARAAFSPGIQYLVRELGVAVLQPNVRGSTGYGRSFTGLDDGTKRFDAVKDIGALLDWIATRSDLDASRVAVTGGSYGGFMVLASLVEYGDRLRCGADMVGISSFVTFLERTSPYRRDLRRVEYGDERDPEVRAWMERTAPLANAERITRPLLVGQGKNDPRVPWTEAEQIVAKVRATGGEAWYLLAEDEGHGFARRSNQEAWEAVRATFFRRCLLP